MKKFIAEMQERFTGDLSRAAHDYLETGLSKFHDSLEQNSEASQASLGNITAGLELLIKSYIASKNLANIFIDMPPDIRVFLSSPDSVPAFFKWRNLAVDIRTNAWRTIGFSDCIASFYMLFPHLKQLYMPHLRVLDELSGPSLHTILRPLDRFTSERIGYAVLGVVSTLGADESFTSLWYTLSKEDTGFVQAFEKRREERVLLGLEQARQKSGDHPPETASTVVSHGWEDFAVVCPVCHFSGLLEGYTELAIGEDEEGMSPSLDFFASGYHCEECGLTLYDSEELKLANMNTLYDRSDEIDRWFIDHDTSPDIFSGGGM